MQTQSARYRTTYAFCMIAAGWLIPLSGLCSNLLVNGDFDNPPGNLSGWTAAGPNPPGNYAVWNGAENYSGSAGSGAAYFSGAVIYNSYLLQCITVTPGVTYDLVGYVKATNNSIVKSGAGTGISLYSFASADCSGSSLNSRSTSVNEAVNWTRVGLGDFDPGAGAQSIQVQILASASGLSTNIQANWDGLALGANGTVPVRLQQFEID